MKILTVSAALLSLALAAPVMAQSSTSGNPTSGTDTTATHGSQTMGETGMNGANGDVKSLLTQLVQDNQQEIAMGKLALENAKSKLVKDFAKKLIADHTAAAKKVEPIATAKGVDVSASAGSMSGMSGSASGNVSGSGANVNGSATATGSTASGDMNASASDKMSKLQALKGSEFDREFASMMVDDHQQAISLLDQIKSAAAGDKQLTTMVDQLHKTIEMHLTSAKALVKTVGSPRHDTRGTDMNNNGAEKTPDQNQNGTTTH